jgi:catechol 2,3-dioxygenase-like lactoylglutathione lyase family enzyme
VRSVEGSFAWYRDKLGLEPLHVGDDGPKHPIASFVIAGAVIALWQLAPDETSVAHHAGSYVVEVMNTDLRQLRQRLIDRGVEVGELGRSAHNESVGFYDLDGNRFELSRPLRADTCIAETC